jgi:hypothetical protein
VSWRRQIDERLKEVEEMEWSVNIICKVNKVAKSTKQKSNKINSKQKLNNNNKNK